MKDSFFSQLFGHLLCNLLGYRLNRLLDLFIKCIASELMGATYDLLKDQTSNNPRLQIPQ